MGYKVIVKKICFYVYFVVLEIFVKGFFLYNFKYKS